MASVASPVDREIRELLDQIIRDNWTLNHCTDLCPDRDFYEARIVSYYDTIRQLQEGPHAESR